jgi:eukaryotic-like serine/threonine-protein kinase
MPIAAGQRLGPYEIQSLIGAGGMGEVYKARDTRLDRTVAIKVLPPGLSADPERRHRFEREARAISSLAHPHICTLYDVGEQDGTAFLVMEHLEGETLAARLARGAIPLGQVLDLGAQIAEGLAAAHRAGIIHRDLKPGNIMLTGTGVKLLDFGLARWHSESPVAASLVSAPTRSGPLTGQGAIVGTLQYMAPEQIDGREADARTDLFAFGAVIYEMLTGRRAFEGHSAASLMGAILERDPAPLATHQPLTPPALDRLVRKCLAKAPDGRWDSAHDVADELRWIAQTLGETSDAKGTRASWRSVVLGAVLPAIVATAALTGGAAWLWRPATPARTVRVELGVAPARELHNRGFSESWARAGMRTAFTWTADGLVFVGHDGGPNRLYLRDLGSFHARPFPGTENAQMPVASSDGRSIVFYGNSDDGATMALKRIAIDGTATETLLATTEFPPFGMAVSASGLVAFARQDGGGIWTVRSGSPAERLTTPAQGEVRHVLPHWLVDDEVLLYTVRRSALTWGTEHVVAVVLATGERKVVLRDAADARYVSTGHIVFMRLGQLMAVPFDPVRREVTGEVVALRRGVAQALLARSSADHSGAGQFAVSRAGDLAYVPGEPVAPPQADLVSVDRQGRVSSLGFERSSFGGPLHLSPDGGRLAVPIRRLTSHLLWIADLPRHSLRNVTDDGESLLPRWTPDSSRVAFAWIRDGEQRLAWRVADATAPPQNLSSGDFSPASWSPDGRHLAAIEEGRRIVVLTFDSGEPTRELVTDIDDIWETAPAFSPDGGWLLYQSTMGRRGRFDIYARPYPGPGEPVLLSRGGGESPAWNPRGGEVFYVDPSGEKQRVLSVTFDAGRAGTPRLLFEADERTRFGCQPVPCYAVAPGGDRFYTVRMVPTTPPEPVTHVNVVLNWTEELKAKVPVK